MQSIGKYAAVKRNNTLYLLGQPVADSLTETASDAQLYAWAYLVIDRNNNVTKCRL